MRLRPVELRPILRAMRCLIRRIMMIKKRSRTSFHNHMNSHINQIIEMSEIAL